MLKAISSLIFSDSTLKIYVDGSHIKGTRKLGYGILFVDEYGNEYGISNSGITPNFMNKKFGIRKEQARYLSNPTMEFAAVAHALEIASKTNKEKIIIHYDYIGSEKWLNGEWKAKKPHIKSIYSKAKKSLNTIEEKGIDVEWVHIKSHSGHRENDIADLLAKGEYQGDLLNINELIE